MRANVIKIIARDTTTRPVAQIFIFWASSINFVPTIFSLHINRACNLCKNIFLLLLKCSSTLKYNLIF